MRKQTKYMLEPRIMDAMYSRMTLDQLLNMRQTSSEWNKRLKKPCEDELQDADRTQKCNHPYLYDPNHPPATIVWISIDAISEELSIVQKNEIIKVYEEALLFL